MAVLTQAFVGRPGLPTALVARPHAPADARQVRDTRVWAFSVNRLELDDMPGTGRR